jgi:hypothetical protein
VQHVHLVAELRHVEHPEGAIGGPASDLPAARTDGGHRLPVVWFKTELHLFELESCVVAGLLRKVAKVVE